MAEHAEHVHCYLQHSGAGILVLVVGIGAVVDEEECYSAQVLADGARSSHPNPLQNPLGVCVPCLSKMTLSRPHPRAPPYPENTVLVQGPTHPQKSAGELLSYKVALQ